jgi:hypothetical protein
MVDLVSEIIEDILEYMYATDNTTASDFQEYLTENGFMIVPIEDPTNLRYGADD